MAAAAHPCHVPVPAREGRSFQGPTGDIDGTEDDGGGEHQEVTAHQPVHPEVLAHARPAVHPQELEAREPEEDPDEGVHHPPDELADDPPVARIREQPHIDPEPSLLERTAEAVEAARQPSQDRQQRDQLVASRVTGTLRSQPLGEPGRGVHTG